MLICLRAPGKTGQWPSPSPGNTNVSQTKGSNIWGLKLSLPLILFNLINFYFFMESQRDIHVLDREHLASYSWRLHNFYIWDLPSTTTVLTYGGKCYSFIFTPKNCCGTTSSMHPSLFSFNFPWNMDKGCITPERTPPITIQMCSFELILNHILFQSAITDIFGHLVAAKTSRKQNDIMNLLANSCLFTHPAVAEQH